MLGLWTRNFRRFLSALAGTSCPVCAVIDGEARKNLKKIAQRRSLQGRHLCGSHLTNLLDFMTDAAIRVSAVQEALQASIMKQTKPRGDRCELCALSHRLIGRLARAIAAMDGRVRFEKALQSGPLVCSAHLSEILNTARPEGFRQIQHQKIEALIAEIGQSRVRHCDNLDDLIASAISYLGSTDRERIAPNTLGAPGVCADTKLLAAATQTEFESWDEAKRLAHLSNIESEAASLRYHNGILSEENRRLKLAYSAGEAIRNDLERDRWELIAAVRNSRSSKSSEER